MRRQGLEGREKEEGPARLGPTFRRRGEKRCSGDGWVRTAQGKEDKMGLIDRWRPTKVRAVSNAGEQ